MVKYIPLRTLMGLTFGLVCLVAGHVGAPQALFYLRFVNSEYGWYDEDKYILALTVAAITISLTSWFRKSLRLSLAAVPAYVISTYLAHKTWSSERDLQLAVITGLPFLGTVIATGVIAFRAPRRRAGVCRKCEYAMGSLPRCPECGKFAAVGGESKGG